MRDVNAAKSYSDNFQIKDLRAVIYDALGNEIKTIKEKDFRDVSAVSDFSLYEDNRVKYMEYTPRSYPITVHFTAKVEISSTAFLPRWMPMEDFYVGVESSTFRVLNDSEINLKTKEENFEGYEVAVDGKNKWSISNVPALKKEAYQPSLSKTTPIVKVALEVFKMEGVGGANKDWKQFGKWMHDELLSDVQELPQNVKDEIKSLTAGANTDREKAEIVYQFMQDRSRYISVQVGIGGWKPIDASEVHNMAYGDCKGLSNYTMALLKEVGVDANYVGIYGGSSIINFDTEFSMPEGNHAIIMLPQLDGQDDVWLECTSKTNPFGFLGGFTDDRDALVITPEGGKIMHTTAYPGDLSKQLTVATVSLKPDGSAAAELEMTTTGVQYAWRSDVIDNTAIDTKSNYMERWSHLNGMTVMGSGINNNKKIPELREKVEMNIERYASKTGNLLLFHPVVFNRNTSEPPVYDNRYFDVEIQRGYVDIDQYTIALEPGMVVDALPEPVEIINKFGTYQLTVSAKGENEIEVKRFLKMESGTFKSTEYADFRKFRSDIVKHDNARGVIKL
ncbi:hypothetical protein NMS_0371 [Nonlabens marinus S1-08]|uniref:DUF3857 domain-containing protein n=2 Tax=Nonlabens TaxID=363408 RepID=W8VPB3_9FLAO|nr:hypothetical protein NMS_0371 [Nonlabens marinus S1-08]